MASVSKRPKFLDNFSKCSNIEKDAIEDITVSKSKNLLLFQIPNGLDVQMLSGISVTLKGEEEFDVQHKKKSNNSSEDVKYKTVVETVDPKSQPCVLLPGEQDGAFRLGPPIAKQIRVYKQYNLLDVEYPEVKSTRVKHPEGLKQRWRPFGWEEPPTISKETEPRTTPKKKKEKKLKKKKKKSSYE